MSYEAVALCTNNSSSSSSAPPPLAYSWIRHTGSQLGQAHDGVVGGREVGEVLAEEALEPGHVGQGQVVGRREGLGLGPGGPQSQAEQQHP